MNRCKECGGQTRNPKSGPLPTYCSQQCRTAAHHRRAKAEGRTAQWQARRSAKKAKARALRPPKKCPYCGGNMTNLKRVQCGEPACKRAFNNQRQLQFFAERKRRDGVAYSSRYKDKRKVYAKNRRARKRNAYVEDVDPQYIFRRDGWRCQICGKKVRRNVQPRHPLAPTVDHIIPLAAGGEHSKANTRCAHYRCNSSKQDRLDPVVQGVLFG